mgnify:CR=1 FL=1
MSPSIHDPQDPVMEVRESDYSVTAVCHGAIHGVSRPYVVCGARPGQDKGPGTVGARVRARVGLGSELGQICFEAHEP